MKKTPSVLTAVMLGLSSVLIHISAQAEMIQAHAVHDHQRCQICGMVINNYPGPKGQVIFKDSDKSASFCSTRDLFNFILQPENKRQVSHIFVQDTAQTDWENSRDGVFIEATSAFYVYGTNKKAVMGPAVVPFTNRAAAESFAKAHGGEVYSYEQIDLAMLARTDVPHQRQPKSMHGHQHQQSEHHQHVHHDEHHADHRKPQHHGSHQHLAH